MKQRLSWLALLVGLLGCQEAPPRELKLELPEVVTSKDPIVVHTRAVQEDGRSRSPSGKLDYRVQPPDLARVSPNGALVCVRSGEGRVTLRLGGVEGGAKLACKLAARLEVPSKLHLDASAGEADPRVRVLDAAGQELDLPVSITSDRPSVVQSRAGRLAPGNVGKATVTVRAGALSKQVEVVVVRTLQPEVLPIDQNRRISYSLPAGKYQLTLKLSSPRPIAVSWLGAPYCAYRGDASEHRSECTLQHKGSVSFDNPAFVLRGEKTPSTEGVTLQEVP